MYSYCQGIPSDLDGFNTLETHVMDYVLECFEKLTVFRKNYLGSRLTMLTQCTSWKVSHSPNNESICYADGCGLTIDEDDLKLGMLPIEPKGAVLVHRWYHWECLRDYDINHLVLNSRHAEKMEGFHQISYSSQLKIETGFDRFKRKYYPNGVSFDFHAGL
jgi:hypothetical protein